jgi:acyl carrier protein
LRIEPGEIEAALERQPGVREALVLAREDVPGDVRLVAYLTARPGQTPPAPEHLRAQLALTLPHYMLPAHCVTLAAFPLTPNGKVDRAALPAPDGLRGTAGFVAPRSPTETAIAAIWAEVLQLDMVGIHDNFFAIGGNSLMALQANHLIEQRVGQAVPTHVLFSAQSVVELSDYIEENGGFHDRPHSTSHPSTAHPAGYTEVRI